MRYLTKDLIICDTTYRNAIDDYMNTSQPQIFEDTGQNTTETHVQMYNGNHNWPASANQWVADYFTELLY